MSKIDLVSREWCDIVFEGRNKEYGAYRMRANAGKRQLRALLIVIVLLAAVLAVVGINAVVEMIACTVVAGTVCKALEKAKLIGG